jgi:isocitrate dehydrogenase
MYWAQALAEQNADAELKAAFAPVAAKLAANEKQIVDELIAVQGKPVEIGGYYQSDTAKASAALRPSKTFNDILASL